MQQIYQCPMSLYPQLMEKLKEMEWDYYVTAVLIVEKSEIEAFHTVDGVNGKVNLKRGNVIVMFSDDYKAPLPVISVGLNYVEPYFVPSGIIEASCIGTDVNSLKMNINEYLKLEIGKCFECFQELLEDGLVDEQNYIESVDSLCNDLKFAYQISKEKIIIGR